MLAVECRLKMGNFEFRDLIVEFELREYEAIEAAVWRVLWNMPGRVVFTFSSVRFLLRCAVLIKKRLSFERLADSK